MAARRSSQARPARTAARRSSGEELYVHGNTVRKLQPVEEPVRRPAEPPRREERPRTGRAVRRNQEKALQMDLPYLILLVAAACCTLYICVTYLNLQSELNARMDHIKVLEQEIETMKSENDALETRINTSLDLDEVYRVATEELGMVYAGRDQVLLYNKTESEYVRQNEDIPQY